MSLNMLCAFIFIMKIVKVSIVMGSVVFSCDNKNNNNASEAFHDDKKTHEKLRNQFWKSYYDNL